MRKKQRVGYCGWSVRWWSHQESRFYTLRIAGIVDLAVRPDLEENNARLDCDECEVIVTKASQIFIDMTIGRELCTTDDGAENLSAIE